MSSSLSSDSGNIGSVYAMECKLNHASCNVQDAISADGTAITILGFGSLLSKKSSQLTFPNLQNFRCVRVPNYQRMFAHPTSIFFQRGIANLDTQEMASLSCEYKTANNNNNNNNDDDDLSNNQSFGFVAVAFEIPIDEMMDTTTNTYTPKAEFVQREEEFAIIPVPYDEMDIDGTTESTESKTTRTVGMICAKSSDEIYMTKWGRDQFQLRYAQYGLSTIWDYPPATSIIKPCTIYLYHCYMASQTMGTQCHESFLDETYLVDRTTTLRQYLKDRPALFHNLQIPPELQDRYCG